MDELAKKVEKHKIEINHINDTLKDFAEEFKKLNAGIAKISEAISKQEVILQRIETLEEKYITGLQNIDKRINSEVDRHVEKLQVLEEKVVNLKKDLDSRPCKSCALANKDIEYLKEKVNQHSNIVTWGARLIVGGVITALMGLVLWRH